LERKPLHRGGKAFIISPCPDFAESVSIVAPTPETIPDIESLLTIWAPFLPETASVSSMAAAMSV
jgi:hypothetical protein